MDLGTEFVVGSSVVVAKEGGTGGGGKDEDPFSWMPVIWCVVIGIGLGLLIVSFLL